MTRRARQGADRQRGLERVHHHVTLHFVGGGTARRHMHHRLCHAKTVTEEWLIPDCSSKAKAHTQQHYDRHHAGRSEGQTQRGPQTVATECTSLGISHRDATPLCFRAIANASWMMNTSSTTPLSISTACNEPTSNCTLNMGKIVWSMSP